MTVMTRKLCLKMKWTKSWSRWTRHLSTTVTCVVVALTAWINLWTTETLIVWPVSMDQNNICVVHF